MYAPDMLARLALLFVVIPLVELALLVQLGQWVGLWPTLGLVVVTGVLGAGLARAEGLKTLLAFQSELAEGRLPKGPLMDGLAVLVGGAFLLTPGLLTDLAGFSLLIPPTRRWLQGRLWRWLEAQAETGRLTVGVWAPRPPSPGSQNPAAFGSSGSDGALDPGQEISQDQGDG